MERVHFPLLIVACALQTPRFDFLHVSDTHVEARASGAPALEKLRGEETFEWIARAMAAEERKPEFVLATGDLTEFGAPGDTWQDVVRLFGKLPIPWYPVMGNHDQTWNPIDAPYQALLDARTVRMRSGRSYVLKNDGWALAVVNSASLYEPRPSFAPKELEELEHVLGVHMWGVPLLVAMHHPPDSAEFAQPWSSRMLFSALDGLDVQLILYGHGHRARHSRVFGVDCVQGGSTFASKNVDERGFGRVSLQDGVLRSTYRWLDASKSERVLVEKPLNDPKPASRLTIRVEVATASHPDLLTAEWFPPSPLADELTERARVLVDGERVPGARWTHAACEDCSRLEMPLATLPLGDGLRLVTVEFSQQDGRVRQKSITARAPKPMSAAPPAPTSGPRMPTSIQHRPTQKYAHWYDDAGGIDERASLLLHDVIPGRPLRVGDTLYVGDSNGRVHAITLRWNGEKYADRILWSSEPLGMAIESAPALVGDLLVVGAWDGNVHAFDAKTGERKWSKPGPKSSEGGAARYYAPADCSPVVLQDRIYVCDRGYMLAWYSLTGEMHILPHANVAAIGASADGAQLYLRGTDDVLTRIDRDGAVVWSAKVPLGRAPVPPLEKDGIVHVISDQGLYSRVVASTGAVVATIPTSATAFVFSAPILHDDGSVEIRSQGGTTFRWTPEPARPVSPAPAGPR